MDEKAERLTKCALCGKRNICKYVDDFQTLEHNLFAQLQFSPDRYQLECRYFEHDETYGPQEDRERDELDDMIDEAINNVKKKVIVMGDPNKLPPMFRQILGLD